MAPQKPGLFIFLSTTAESNYELFKCKETSLVCWEIIFSSPWDSTLKYDSEGILETKFKFKINPILSYCVKKVQTRHLLTVFFFLYLH